MCQASNLALGKLKLVFHKAWSWALCCSFYINDLPLHIDFCHLDLYADDSTMSASDSSVQALINYLMADLINFDTGCKDNDMTLHLGKTIAMFLSTKQGTSKSCQILQLFPYMTVQSKYQSKRSFLESSLTTTFLGVLI